MNASTPLSPAVGKILLLGFTAVRPNKLTLDDKRTLSTLSRGGPIAIAQWWNEHADELLKRAKRDRIRPVGGRQFFGEKVSRRIAEKQARREARQRQP